MLDLDWPGPPRDPGYGAQGSERVGRALPRDRQTASDEVDVGGVGSRGDATQKLDIGELVNGRPGDRAPVGRLGVDTGWHRQWIGKKNREDLTFPIWQLRDWARALGLVRKYKGELRPTRRGAALKNDREALADLIARSIPHDRLYGTPLDWF